MDKMLLMHLRGVIEALSSIEVKGRDNMEKLLGSIQYLEKIAIGEFGEFVQAQSSNKE